MSIPINCFPCFEHVWDHRWLVGVVSPLVREMEDGLVEGFKTEIFF